MTRARETRADTSPTKGLDDELDKLRASLLQARESMADGEDAAKMGALVARLSDSIGRALLTQQKLNSVSDRSSLLRDEVERILEEVGLVGRAI